MATAGVKWFNESNAFRFVTRDDCGADGRQASNIRSAE
jgi:cold shock CspA family protein